MNDLNNVVISGRLTRDVDYQDRNDFKIGKFALAVNYNYKKGNDWKTDTTFIDIVCWNSLADIANRILTKGSTINVVGRLQQETWKADDGSNRSRLVLRADNINKLKDAPQPKDVAVGQGAKEFKEQTPEM